MAQKNEAKTTRASDQVKQDEIWRNNIRKEHTMAKGWKESWGFLIECTQQQNMVR